MTPLRSAYPEAAAVAVSLLASPEVAAQWEKPSALPEFRVSGLAGHLARQVTHPARLLAAAAPDGLPLSLADHYARSAWRGAALDDEVSVSIRQDGEAEAAASPAALVTQAGAALDEMRAHLAGAQADRLVHLPWGPWTLTLDDFLLTRTLEIVIHSDDLAVSVGVPTPEMPPAAMAPVLALLTQLAVTRHGTTPVLRTFSRAERAPGSIAAL